MHRSMKLVCLTLVALTLVAVMAPAYALTGTVVGGRLNLRKAASTSTPIIGYIPNGSTVTIHGIQGDFYHITAPSYLSGQTAEDCIYRFGYGMKSFIK